MVVCEPAFLHIETALDQMRFLQFSQVWLESIIKDKW